MIYTQENNIHTESLSLSLSHLIQHYAQVAKQRALARGCHDTRNARDEVRGLLPHRGPLVVQPPFDGSRYLGQVGLAAGSAQCVNNDAESVQDHAGGGVGAGAAGRACVLCGRGLLLERVENAVDQALLQAGLNVTRALCGDDLLRGLHHLYVNKTKNADMRVGVYEYT